MPDLRLLLTLSLLLGCGDKTTDTTDTTTSSSTTSATGDPTTGTSAGATTTSTTGDDPTTGPIITTSTSTITTSTTGGPGDGTCRSDADCDADMFESCFAPDEVNCGDCQIPDDPCDEQMACDFGLTCVPFVAPCACNPGDTQCVPILLCMTDDECPDGQSCDVEGTCTHETCDAGQALCPPQFDCDPNATTDDHCVRHPCAADDECSAGGFCVEGHCFTSLGACMPPAP